VFAKYLEIGRGLATASPDSTRSMRGRISEVVLWIDGMKDEVSASAADKLEAISLKLSQSKPSLARERVMSDLVGVRTSEAELFLDWIATPAWLDAAEFEREWPP